MLPSFFAERSLLIFRESASCELHCQCLEPAPTLSEPMPRRLEMRAVWSKVGVAQNERARVTQVLVFGSIYQGAILVHLFEPLSVQGKEGVSMPRKSCCEPDI